MGSMTATDVWTLAATPAWLRSAATTWSSLGTGLSTQESAVVAGKSRLASAWRCARADSYFAHNGRLAPALTAASAQATAVSRALSTLATDLASVQAQLAASYRRAGVGSTHVADLGDSIVFTFAGETAPAAIAQEAEQASRLQSEAQSNVAACDSAIRAVVGPLQSLGIAWRGPGSGKPGWAVPTGHRAGGSITESGTTSVVNTGDGNDRVSITHDPATGETKVTVNGVTYRIPKGRQVVINTGGGRDTIDIPAGLPSGVRVVTGTGGDTVSARESSAGVEVFAGAGRDTVTTGDGKDYASGGTGEDYLDLGRGDDVGSGGAGNDVIYGMHGNDVLLGGSDDDYLEGAKGNDTAFGGAGSDIVSGGDDNDVLVGGADGTDPNDKDTSDTIYAGTGHDRVVGYGSDTAYVEVGDRTTTPRTHTARVAIDPSVIDKLFDFPSDPRLAARMRADLAMMASGPGGARMLNKLWDFYNDEQSDGYHKKIKLEKDEGNSQASHEDYTVGYDPDERYFYNPKNTSGPPDADHPDGTADPVENWNRHGMPPAVALFHELGHIHQYDSGEDDGRFTGPDGKRTVNAKSGDRDIELQNTGLKWDYDHDPDTPDGVDPDYDHDYTENGWREELGLWSRDRY